MTTTSGRPHTPCRGIGALRACAVLLCYTHELLQYETHVACCRSVDATSGAELWNVSYGRVTPLLEGVALAPDAWINPVGQSDYPHSQYLKLAGCMDADLRHLAVRTADSYFGC